MVRCATFVKDKITSNLYAWRKKGLSRPNKISLLEQGSNLATSEQINESNEVGISIDDISIGQISDDMYHKSDNKLTISLSIKGH